jgi:hypothetical protein
MQLQSTFCDGSRYHSGDTIHRHHGAVVGYSSAERRATTIYLADWSGRTHCARVCAASIKEFKDAAGDGLSRLRFVVAGWMRRKQYSDPRPDTNSRTKGTRHAGWNFGGYRDGQQRQPGRHGNEHGKSYGAVNWQLAKPGQPQITQIDADQNN